MRHLDIFLAGVLSGAELNRAAAAQDTVGGQVNGARLRCHCPKRIERRCFEAVGKTDEILLPVRPVPKPCVSEGDSEQTVASTEKQERSIRWNKSQGVAVPGWRHLLGSSLQ